MTNARNANEAFTDLVGTFADDRVNEALANGGMSSTFSADEERRADAADHKRREEIKQSKHQQAMGTSSAQSGGTGNGINYAAGINAGLDIMQQQTDKEVTDAQAQAAKGSDDTVARAQADAVKQMATAAKMAAMKPSADVAAKLAAANARLANVQQHQTAFYVAHPELAPKKELPKEASSGPSKWVIGIATVGAAALGFFAYKKWKRK